MASRILAVTDFNPRRARVTVLGLCVCVSVTTFSATARYNAHNKTYHRPQWDMRKVLNLFVSEKIIRSGTMAILTYSSTVAIFLALLRMHIPT